MTPPLSIATGSLILLLSLVTTPARSGAQQTAPSIVSGADTTPADSGGARPPAPAPAPDSSSPRVQLSGVVFGNYQIQTDSATRAANGGTSRNRFEVKRAYLTVQGSAGKRASFRVTTDIKQNAGSGSFYNGMFVRLKYAYLQYDLLQARASGLSAFARIGLLHTVLIDYEERFWPRYLGETAPDRFGFFPSSDLGASAGLTLPGSWGEIYGTITNGNGYENPEADRFKDVALRVSLTPLAAMRAAGTPPSILSTLSISPWVYAGQTESAFLASDSVTDGLARNRWGIFVGVRDRRLTAGAEYARRMDGSESGLDAAERTVSTTTGELIDGFVVARPLELVNPTRKSAFGVVARYDRFKPNRDAGGTRRFTTLGVFLEPTSKTTLALDYQRQDARGYPVGAAPATQSVWYLHWQVTF